MPDRRNAQILAERVAAAIGERDAVSRFLGIAVDQVGPGFARLSMTVTADIGGKRVDAVHRLCPDIDIMGINSYGGASSLPERYRRAGGTKPYVVTEYGPPGTWEIGRNAWGAVEEWSSTRKARNWRRSSSSSETFFAAAMRASHGRTMVGRTILWMSDS